jgi:hypothetical protein
MALYSCSAPVTISSTIYIYCLDAYLFKYKSLVSLQILDCGPTESVIILPCCVLSIIRA